MNHLEIKILSILKGELIEFKQVKNRFYEFHNDLTNLVEIQFLPVGKNEKAFTIYFGVLVPKIFSLLWSEYKIDDLKKFDTRNGVFNCNINDLLQDFKGKPKIKYWDLMDDEPLFNEIKIIVRDQLVPVIKKITSLEELDTFIDKTDYPWKNSVDIPVMRLALKFLLNKNEDFFSLASKLKLENNHFSPLIDKLLKKKNFE